MKLIKKYVNNIFIIIQNFYYYTKFKFINKLYIFKYLQY